MHPTLRIISWPIGASQLAPPTTIVRSGRAAFRRCAIAKVATFCWNIEVKPTIADASMRWRAISSSMKAATAAAAFEHRRLEPLDLGERSG